MAIESAWPTHSGLPQSPARRALRRLLGNPLGLTGIVILALLVLTAIFADLLAPYSPIQMGAGPLRSPPTLKNLFGTDQLGRDILSQTIHGARLSLWIVTLAISIAFAAGSVLGLVAGYLGGLADAVIMRIADAMLAIPGIILALAIVAWLGPNLTNTMLAIAMVNISGFARLVRGEVLGVRSQPFIQAARLQGFSNLRIISRHIWPNITGNVVVFASLTASQALITEAGLSFLGLGVQPPNPSWGRMVATGIDYYQHWWMSFFPGAAIFLVVIALNFLGDAVRDASDKRLSGSDAA
jgi:peptide/nickel transport system permease protein